MKTTRAASVLEELRAGNERFTSGNPIRPRRGATTRASLARVQNPHTTVFTCADSRVVPTLAFDQGIGDLFVVRTAGHVLDGAAAASIAFATDVLKTPVVVILGHTNCGAVMAAHSDADVPESVLPVVTPIVEAASGCDHVDDAIAANARATRDAVAKNAPDALVVAAVYNVATGAVDWL